MKNLLDYTLTRLVDYPEDVKIDEASNEYGETVYTLRVNQADIPRLIGKNGNMIKALRKIVQGLAGISQQRIRLQIAED